MQTLTFPSLCFILIFFSSGLTLVSIRVGISLYVVPLRQPQYSTYKVKAFTFLLMWSFVLKQERTSNFRAKSLRLFLTLSRPLTTTQILDAVFYFSAAPRKFGIAT